jgi:hypothetical protein
VGCHASQKGHRTPLRFEHFRPRPSTRPAGRGVLGRPACTTRPPRTAPTQRPPSARQASRRGDVESTGGTDSADDGFLETVANQPSHRHDRHECALNCDDAVTVSVTVGGRSAVVTVVTVARYQFPRDGERGRAPGWPEVVTGGTVAWHRSVMLSGGRPIGDARGRLWGGAREARHRGGRVLDMGAWVSSLRVPSSG